MRYWDNTGKYETEAAALQELVPLNGQCVTFKGEIWRATAKIYWDYYNNGFGNNWESPAAFLLDHIKLPDSVRDMFYACGRGNIAADQYNEAIELMVDTVIETLRDMQDRSWRHDMWKWPISLRHNFEDASYDDDYNS